MSRVGKSYRSLDDVLDSGEKQAEGEDMRQHVCPRTAYTGNRARDPTTPL